MNDSIGDNCKDMRELLSAYHDAELDSNDRNAVENHLSNCSDCRAELAAVESVVSSLKTLPPVTLSKDFSLDIESLVKRAEAEKPAERKVDNNNVVPISRKKPLGLIAAAAAAAVVLIVAAFVSTTGGIPMVATGTGETPQVIAAKDNPVSATDVGGQDKRLIASADIEPSSTDASTKDAESSKSSTKPNLTIGKSDLTVKKDATPAHLSAPLIASVKPSAPRHNSVVHVDDLADNQALVAYSDTVESEVFENSGMSTDEDGLYAIKM